MRGILGMDPAVRNGFDGIKVTYNIDADASPDDIKAPRNSLPTLSDVPFQCLGNMLLWHCSHNLLDNLPVLEQ